MPLRFQLGLAAGAVALAFPAVAAAQSSAPAVTDSVYTAAQAQRGRRIYGAFCATCHGVDLEGAVGPALAGPTFTAKWARDDHPVRLLLDVMRTTMPRPAAGSLADSSYLQVLAYVLSRNGLPAGRHALADSSSVLASLHVPPAPTGRPPAPEFIAGKHGTTPTGSGPSAADLASATTSTDWLYANHDFAGTRHAPLHQITPANAAELRPVCAYQVGSLESFVTSPVEWHGTLYVTTARLTIALDAATCRERWRYDWEPRDQFLLPNNRGVAIANGYVVRGTADGYLLALDAATGHLLWARQIGKPADGESITMPPLIYHDMVIIGPAVSEYNIQGWIGAFRLKDGTQVWRFHTVPLPGEPGSDTWAHAPGVPVGGGGVWTAPTLDPATDALYVAVGNPAPDLPAALRPGLNLYTNSVVVLDVRTGALRSYAQLVTHDVHDWDLTQATPLISVRRDGREEPAIVTVGKEGVLRTLDLRTLKPLYATPVTTRLNGDRPLTTAGVHVCPGVLGGVEWSGPAYDPASNLLITPAVDWCTTFALTDTVRFVPGQIYLGGKVTMDSTSQGWLTAMDAASGRVRWRYHSGSPMVAGVTTTAGGVAFTGESSGDFLALDAATGRVLYRFDTGGGMGGGAISYAVDGRQYVAAASGRAGVFFGQTGAPTVFIFALPAGAR